MFCVCLCTDADRRSLATGWLNGVNNHVLFVKRHLELFVARCVNKYVHLVPSLSEHLRAVYERKRSTERVFEDDERYFFHRIPSQRLFFGECVNDPSSCATSSL